MSPVRPHTVGVTLAVRAKPAAKKNAVLSVANGEVNVSVTAPPEDGRANEAIAELLRKWLKLKRSQVSLLNGATHKSKVFLLSGLSVEAVAERVAQLA